MIDPIVIGNDLEQGDRLQATFFPDQGMNLVSLKKGDLEVIDQSTREQFEERFAGLGALIGPHFHRRHPSALPKIKDESLFPHIARVKAKGIADPFSHGIARYAPWKAISTPNSILATLTGKDTWNGVSLAELEGQNFTMHYKATITNKGMEIALDVVSDADSLVGIHYYYHLPQGIGKVISHVASEYMNQRVRQSIPKEWGMDSQNKLIFDLNQEADYTFYPFPQPCQGVITLDAGAYQLVTTYTCPSQENGWQLYHPKGASFVCIEPVSSQDPRHPNLTVSSLKISLEIKG